MTLASDAHGLLVARLTVDCLGENVWRVHSMQQSDQ